MHWRQWTEMYSSFWEFARNLRRRCYENCRQVSWLRPFQFGAVFAYAESERKAEQLLIENLTPRQKDQFKNEKCFSVTGGQTGNQYLITRGRSMNIYRLGDKGQRLEQLCFHPVELLPISDNMLAQKLMLEACETEALAIANKQGPIFDHFLTFTCA